MSGRTTRIALRGLAALALVIAAMLTGTGRAHEIPNDVRIQAFVKPEPGRLLLLVRVPLAAMREVDVPVRGPGYLDLARAESALRTAASLWLADNIDVREDDRALPSPRIVDVRVTLPSDRSFVTFDRAMAHLASPRVAPDTDLYWNQQLMDALLEYRIDSEHARFSIHPRLARLGLQVVTALRFLPPSGEERAFELHGDPGVVQLDPRWHQAALRFVELGVRHVLDGTDHLLFILCLVIPFRRLRPLVVIATAFTIAHSITLMAAAFGMAPSALWFAPLVETLIAASILVTAVENIFGPEPGRRWLVAFAFGLVHGFGFSFVLGDTLQFAGSHLVTALVAFNLGVEIGQLAALAVLVPALHLLMRFVRERTATIVLCVLVGHTAWHWTLERGADLRKFPLPALDDASTASLLRWLLAALVLAALAWLADGHVRRWMGRSADQPGNR